LPHVSQLSPLVIGLLLPTRLDQAILATPTLDDCADGSALHSRFLQALRCLITLSSVSLHQLSLLPYGVS
jgi:hypothetical protein